MNRDLEGRIISNIRHLVTSFLLARGSSSVMRVFGGLVSYAEVLHSEVPVVKCYNIWRACKSDTVHSIYRGADKSLARPGRKQATATEDFDVHISYLLS